MSEQAKSPLARAVAVFLVLGIAGAFVAWIVLRDKGDGVVEPPARALEYLPRQKYDPTGAVESFDEIKVWAPDASLETIAASWDRLGYRVIATIDQSLADPKTTSTQRIRLQLRKATLLNYEGESVNAYTALTDARSLAEKDPPSAEELLYTLIYFQGLASLRRGETENCVMCRARVRAFCRFRPPPSIRIRPVPGRRYSISWSISRSSRTIWKSAGS